VYFAYGSNMDAAQMAVRCPGAVLLGRARLEGWAWRIGARGYATIVREPGACVHGLLWRLAPAHVEALDRYEGVAAALYAKERLAVLDEGGEEREALAYVASDARPGVPVVGYLERIVAAARAHGLPPEHVAVLERWLVR
jgi:gamma-glutamylcyclotransferase (GGCT)/AIG2-like uncharacterized protein YtfP